MTGQNTDDEFTLVHFDLTWENAWKINSGPSNYAGAWGFLKFKEKSGNWDHGTVNYVDGTAAGYGNTETIGYTIITKSDGIGVFVYRNADGNGNTNFTEIQLRWNYRFDAVAEESIIDIQVFAIEMIYIPQGIFSLGSGAGGLEVNSFYTNTGSFGFKTPYDISSESALTISSATGELCYDAASGSGGDQLEPIPAAFPKGYDAYWIMKYEISEDQWICFFSSLTETLKNAHDVTDFNHKNSDLVVDRNTITFESGNATTLAPSGAINFLSYEDNAA